MEVRTMLGIVLGLLGIICALLGLFVIDGISIEFPGIILGALGYYFGLQGGNQAARILGITAAVLNVISMAVSGLSGPPQ